MIPERAETGTDSCEIGWSGPNEREMRLRGKVNSVYFGAQLHVLLNRIRSQCGLFVILKTLPAK